MRLGILLIRSIGRFGLLPLAAHQRQTGQPPHGKSGRTYLKSPCHLHEADRTFNVTIWMPAVWSLVRVFLEFRELARLSFSVSIRPVGETELNAEWKVAIAKSQPDRFRKRSPGDVMY